MKLQKTAAVPMRKKLPPRRKGPQKEEVTRMPCSFRASEPERELLDKAAALSRRDRAGFVLHAALQAANSIVPADDRIEIAA